MKKDLFKKYLENHGWKYITLTHLEDMTLKQRQEYRERNNPWVIWNGSDGYEHYTKLNELLNDDNTINESEIYC